MKDYFYRGFRDGKIFFSLQWLALAGACVWLLSCGGSNSSSGGGQTGSAGEPVVTINTPLSGSTLTAGEQVLFEGSANDPEDGALSGNSLEWTSDVDGVLGTGDSVSISTLSLGDHNITLTATDSDAKTGSDSVFVRVTEPGAAPQPRAGDVNPYAGSLSRLPEKLDDELIVIGRSAVNDETLLGIIDDPIAVYEFNNPSSDPVAPRITAQKAGRTPVAAAAGRILGTPFQQAAFVTQDSAGGTDFLLEIIGLDDPGRDLMAYYDFTVPIPDGKLTVDVADVDAFNEKPGGSANENDQFYDEVILAYQETVGNELRATVKVLSFETAEFPQNRVGPATTPTTERSITTTQPMFPASRLVVHHGDNPTNREPGPHIVVGYLNTQRQIAIDVFKYEHTRDNLNEPDPATDTRVLRHLLHQVISTALTPEAAAAGGWDIVVERGSRLGIANPLDVKDIIIAAYHENGLFVQDAWVLEDRDGFNNPISLPGGPQSFQFARVSAVGNLPEIPFTILPNSKLRVQTGRITSETGRTTSDPNFTCEAIGLIVLADTNRGPAVQSMKSFIPDIFLGPYDFGPSQAPPTWWPGYADIANPIDTTGISNAYLASGGFSTNRNGLIMDRGNPTGTGTEYAYNCTNVSSAPFLGQMPSFYVALPDIGELYSVTASLGSQGRGADITAPMGADMGDAFLMFAADADGDAAYYSNTVCLGTDCRLLFLGDAELHYAIENIETSNVILQQPPKHIDYLQALGGMINVSMHDDYFAEFSQTDVASGSITRKGKTDWSIGAKIGIGLGLPTPPLKKYSSLFTMSLDAEHRTVSEQFNATETMVSLTQTTGAIGDDVVWSKTQSIDYWRFPVQGGKPEDGSAGDGEFAEDAFMEIAVPDEPSTLIGAGTLNENYQPTHQVGNILSYPAFSGDVQDIGELFNFLGDYVPSDANGTRQCKPLENGDPNGCIIWVNNQLERVSEVLYGQEFAGGELQSVTNPIDVAEVLQIGGTSYKAELEFSETIRNGQSVTNTDSIKAEANLKVPLKVKVKKIPLQFGELEEQLRASAAFENAEISENSVGSKTRIVLQLPGTIPTQRSYQIRPSFGFTPGGSLDLGFQVNTEGLTQTFWDQHYTTPDPALNMPFRIVRNESGGFELGTDFSRGRIRGFFVRDGAGIDPQRPDDSVGPLLESVPLAGDQVQLEVRVMNLSVGTPVENLVVEFSAQEYVNGSLLGNPVPIGEFTINYLPHRGQFADLPNGHIKSAYVIWDSNGFGPTAGAALRSWIIYVTLDPADQIPNETHELFDRYSDPLLGPTGDIVDPGLEKGQNNHGWSMVRIAPALSGQAVAALRSIGAGTPSPGGTLSSVKMFAEFAQTAGGTENSTIEGAVGRPIEIGIGFRSSELVLDHGMLRIYDGSPDKGTELLMSRSVQGISRGTATFETFVWRPRRGGSRSLYATYTGGGVDKRIILRIPVRIQ